MATATIDVLLLLVTVGEARHSMLRVLHGVDDAHNEFPYVVSLQGATLEDRAGYELYHQMRQICTGTLIAPNWVLTAAHCIHPIVRLVRFGNMSLPINQSTSYKKILKHIPHPAYKGLETESTYAFQNDIALMLIEQLHMVPIGKASAVDYETLIGRRVRYAGFGLTYDSNEVDHEDKSELVELDKYKPLQLGEGVVVSCSHNLLRWWPAICVAPKCSDIEQNSMYGDSGGPLFFNGKIVGVVSGEVNSPESIYTPVSPYLSWFSKVISETKD